MAPPRQRLLVFVIAYYAESTLKKVLRNEYNQGYGGNQKVGYSYAIAERFDFVAMLHGDGQYAPEELPRLLAPLRDGEADAVFGSRMMERFAALKGGMPLYKSPATPCSPRRRTRCWAPGCPSFTAATASTRWRRWSRFPTGSTPTTFTSTPRSSSSSSTPGCGSASCRFPRTTATRSAG